MSDVNSSLFDQKAPVIVWSAESAVGDVVVGLSLRGDFDQILGLFQQIQTVGAQVPEVEALIELLIPESQGIDGFDRRMIDYAGLTEFDHDFVRVFLRGEEALKACRRGKEERTLQLIDLPEICRENKSEIPYQRAAMPSPSKTKPHSRHSESRCHSTSVGSLKFMKTSFSISR